MLLNASAVGFLSLSVSPIPPLLSVLFGVTCQREDRTKSSSQAPLLKEPHLQDR